MRQKFMGGNNVIISIDSKFPEIIGQKQNIVDKEIEEYGGENKSQRIDFLKKKTSEGALPEIFYLQVSLPILILMLRNLLR